MITTAACEVQPAILEQDPNRVDADAATRHESSDQRAVPGRVCTVQNPAWVGNRYCDDEPVSACVDHCGQQVGSCGCDDQCDQYGDCCPGKPDACDDDGDGDGAGGSVWCVAFALLTVSFGEMMASPTSQDYVGRIAPPNQAALYMGYYFVSMALGNLFGGMLYGHLYGHLARDLGRPDLMWACFGVLMLATAGSFLVYNRYAVTSR